jgi:hypothetical protein
MAPEGVQMLTGVVAMIDALGFKGAWGDVKKPSMEVLRSLRHIGRAAKLHANEANLLLRKDLPAELKHFLKTPDVSVVQLSDTLVVAAGRRQRLRAIWKRHAAQLARDGYDAPLLERAVDGYLLYLVCRCVCRVLRVAALCEPTIVYRGIVTAGMFTIQKNLLLGPAVDEAADLMDVADGPFVWLSPTARRLKHFMLEQGEDDWERLTLKHPIPLKGGQRLPTRALNPFAHCSTGEQKTAKRNLLRRMDSNHIDVCVKRGNAEKFFEAIRDKEVLAAYKVELKARKAKQKDGSKPEAPAADK